MKNFFIYYAYLISYCISIRTQLLFVKDSDQKEILKAMLFALKTHHSVRQRYDDKYPYFYHLKMVMNFAIMFSVDLSKSERKIVILGSLFHDLIEDARLTYNDIVKLFGTEVADVVYACTELRGKNRKERHGTEFVKGLQESRLGTFVKLADITANMTMGKMTGSRMLPMYQKDYPKTKKNLYIEEFKHIFEYIENNLL